MFIANLIFLYHLIVASENLLRVAIGETLDPRLRKYFEKHLEEERDHAKWLAQDLKSINVDVKAIEPALLPIQMAGSVYYLIFHVHPTALLGYMRVLESWPMDKARLDEVSKPYPALARTVRYHIEHDPDHLKDLLEVIESLPEHRKLIDDVSIMTRNYLQQVANQLRAA